MAIGTIIHQRRKSLGLTQEQVAEMLGVTAPAVNKWEKSINCPDISLLAPLARLLKTDVNTLLEFDRDISQPELILICREISLKAQNTDYQAAFESAEEKLREYLRRMLQAQKKGWMLNSSPLFKALNLSQSSASMAQMIVPMLKSMQQSEEFSFLHEYEGFKNLLEEYNVN